MWHGRLARAEKRKTRARRPCHVEKRVHPMRLPIKPPYPPMEAKLVDTIPTGDNWQYEPKWDGFRCLAFRDGDDVFLQSKAGQPLARYFPDAVRALAQLNPKQF